MVDTLRLRSPHVGEDLAEQVSWQLQLREGVDLATGELLYSFTAGQLQGSWDERISVQVKRQMWVVVDGAPPELQACAPYLVVEGSVHKALMGHNVYGGPLDPESSARWFLEHVSWALGCTLPDTDLWQPERVDLAEVYDLGSFAAVEEYCERLLSCVFPRREVQRYGSHALHCPGSTTTLKVYHKGVELRAHDRKRLLRTTMGADRVEALQQLADRLLRLEVGIRKRWLTEHGITAVADLASEELVAVYDREAARLLREGHSEMETVRTHREVSARLRSVYSGELANRLFGTWLQLSALGEAAVKREMTARTFYRQRKQLVDAGVQWHGADVCIRPQLSLVPAGFAPLRTDPRRLADEADVVRLALEPFRKVA